MQTQILTCVIVDDEIGSTDVLSHYVSQIPYLNLKMVFQNPTEALAYLLKNPTDLLITDIMMPRLTGIQLYECIVTQVHTQVIFISGFEREMYKALQYSVVDYLQKPVSEIRFEQATQKALNTVNFKTKNYGEIPEEVLENAFIDYSLLSVAEKKVLGLIGERKTSNEIATELFIALKTVETHRFNIRKKLNLFPQNDLVEIAIFLMERIK